MTAMASQITSLMVVYLTVYSDADQRKHQSSASLAFVRGIHRNRWIPRTKGQLHGKYFHLMTSSCQNWVSKQTSSCLITHQQPVPVSLSGSPYQMWNSHSKDKMMSQMSYPLSRVTVLLCYYLSTLLWTGIQGLFTDPVYLSVGPGFGIYVMNQQVFTNI